MFWNEVLGYGETKKKVGSGRPDQGELLLIELLSHLLQEDQAKKMSAQLFQKFGSFPGVLNARYNDIIEMGEAFKVVADYLRTQQKAISFYLEDYNSGIQRVYDSESAFQLLKPKFIGRRTEAVALLLLDGRSRVLYNDIVNEGSISEVPIYIRQIVQLCLSYSAYDAVIAHNHPSGNPMPSTNDLNATSDLQIALNSIEVNLTDHIIIAESDHLSLKSSEWLKKIKEDVDEYRNALREKTLEEEAALQLWVQKNQKEENSRCADSEGEEVAKGK